MRDKEPEKKIWREMFLQEVSPPNHVIVQLRGNAVALLDPDPRSSVLEVFEG